MPPPNPCFGSLAPSLPQRLVLGLTRIPPLYRGSLRPTWVKVIDLLRKGPVDVRSTYGNFRVYPTSNLVDGAILLHPAYNKEEIDFLQEGLPSSGTFVDIGANIGLYTVALGNRLTSQGRVVAIEPNPICLERLKANIALNDLAGVTVFGVGVGDFHGKARLVILRNDLAIAHIVRDDQNGTFEVRTLIDILKEAGLTSIDALKIDIEGFEKAALEPFFRSASRELWPKRICMEHLHDNNEVAEILRKCGYRLVKNTRNNSLLILEQEAG
jgi:FkbM family methyltransferase